MTEREKRIVAYHEVGHALANVLQKETKPIEKITIIPRTKGTLGYVLHTTEDDKSLYTKNELLANITVLMAGRAAEQLEFGIETSGAASDIEKATAIARQMVSMYGMSDRFGMMQLETIQNRYLDGRPVLQCSDQTGAELDDEVKEILAGCYKNAATLLENDKATLEKIAEFLFNKETLTGDEFMEMLKKGDEHDESQI